MPREFVEESEEDGFDFSEMYLALDDLEAVRPRDVPADVTKAREELHKQLSFMGMGEEGKRIRSILQGIDMDDEQECFEAWSSPASRRMAWP